MAVLVLVWGWVPASAATLDHVGSGLNWTVPWQAIRALDDPKDTGLAGQYDFAGDSQDAEAYWASTENYFFFRMRVAYSGTVIAGQNPTFGGAHLLMIDLVGYNDPPTGVLPDYAVAWDSKSNNAATHGLEMCVLGAQSTIWNGINMNDLDGNGGQKNTIDINADGRSGEGYVQTVDGLVTTNLGTTTFIQYAVSWTYLQTYTALRKTQFENGQWKLALGSIVGATDHANINGDMAGNISISDPTTAGWVSPIPESGAALMFGVGALFLCLKRFGR